MKIALGSFRIFSKILGDIRNSRDTTGINDILVSVVIDKRNKKTGTWTNALQVLSKLYQLPCCTNGRLKTSFSAGLKFFLRLDAEGPVFREGTPCYFILFPAVRTMCSSWVFTVHVKFTVAASFPCVCTVFCAAAECSQSLPDKFSSFCACNYKHCCWSCSLRDCMQWPPQQEEYHRWGRHPPWNENQ